MIWTDETQEDLGKDIVPFTYEQVVLIKDLTYYSIVKVYTNLREVFPLLPKCNYAKLVDEYYLSANVKILMGRVAPVYGAVDTDDVVAMSGLMLNHLLQFEWQNFEVPIVVKRQVLESSIVGTRLSDDVVNSLSENMVYHEFYHLDEYDEE